jgi:hypothetical protein
MGTNTSPGLSEPPLLVMPNLKLDRAVFKVFLERRSLFDPWGIILDERFSSLGVYPVQDLDGPAWDAEVG